MSTDDGSDKTDTLDPRISDPDWIVVLSDPTVAAGLGAEVPHGKVRDFIFKRKADVADDWQKTVSQLQDILTKIPTPSSNFQLDEMSIDLGFTAEGQLAFVAKAGVEATVSITFRRK